MPQNHAIEVHAARLLSAIEDVDAAYLGEVTDERVVVFVLAREHGLVDRETLFGVEDALAERFSPRSFDLRVQAHQVGSSAASLVPARCCSPVRER